MRVGGDKFVGVAFIVYHLRKPHDEALQIARAFEATSLDLWIVGQVFDGQAGPTVVKHVVDQGRQEPAGMGFEEREAFQAGADDITLAAGTAELRPADLAGLLQIVGEHAEAVFNAVHVGGIIQIVGGFEPASWLAIGADGFEQGLLGGILQADGPGAYAQTQIAIRDLPALDAAGFWPPIGLQCDALAGSHSNRSWIPCVAALGKIPSLGAFARLSSQSKIISFDTKQFGNSPGFPDAITTSSATIVPGNVLSGQSQQE